MSATFTETPSMAGRKKENYDRGRVEFKADPEWIQRADEEAKASGLGNLSAFIRFVVTQYMDAKESERDKTKKKRS